MESPKKSTLGLHLGEVRSDLSQLDKVLEDAVAMLFGAFTNISSLVRLQQRISTQFALMHQTGSQHPPGWIEDEQEPALARRDATLPMLFAQQAAIGDQLECQVNAVVHSLQFQDLAAQLVSHAQKRVDWMESALALREGCRRARAGGTDGLANVILFPRSRPVVQQGMQPGDIEVF